MLQNNILNEKKIINAIVIRICTRKLNRKGKVFLNDDQNGNDIVKLSIKKM